MPPEPSSGSRLWRSKLACVVLKSGYGLESLGNGLRRKCKIGIGIGRYKPSGSRDSEIILVGIAKFKNPIGNPRRIERNRRKKLGKHSTKIFGIFAIIICVVSAVITLEK